MATVLRSGEAHGANFFEDLFAGTHSPDEAAERVEKRTKIPSQFG